METKLSNMFSEVFAQHKKATIESLCQQDHTLLDEAERHWDQIAIGRYDFMNRQHLVREIQTVGQTDFVGWYRDHFASAEGRKVLRVRVFSDQHLGHRKFKDRVSYQRSELDATRRSVGVFTKKRVQLKARNVLRM